MDCQGACSRKRGDEPLIDERVQIEGESAFEHMRTHEPDDLASLVLCMSNRLREMFERGSCEYIWEQS